MASNDQQNEERLFQLREMPHEQAELRSKYQIGLAAILQLIKKMSLKLDGFKAPHALEEKRDTETSEAPIAKRIVMDEDEALREAAGKAQEKFKEINPNDVYLALIDPFPRTRQEKVEYAKKAAPVYEGGELVNVQEVFEENFQFWNEE